LGFDTAVNQFSTANTPRDWQGSLRQIEYMLRMAQHDLRLKTRGPLAVAIDAGMTFDYFDSLRRLIDSARQDVLFVDPYLNADFIGRYMPSVANGAAVRLLTATGQYLAGLMPAATAFAQQHQLAVEVRVAAAAIHDRYLFIDRAACYHSGASFKDGGVRAPTVINQIVDAFTAMQQTYESMWASATPQP